MPTTAHLWQPNLQMRGRDVHGVVHTCTCLCSQRTDIPHFNIQLACAFQGRKTAAVTALAEQRPPQARCCCPRFKNPARRRKRRRRLQRKRRRKEAAVEEAAAAVRAWHHQLLRHVALWNTTHAHMTVAAAKVEAEVGEGVGMGVWMPAMMFPRLHGPRGWQRDRGEASWTSRLRPRQGSTKACVKGMGPAGCGARR